MKIFKTLLLLIIPFLGKGQQLCGTRYKNFVPDSITAIKIAEAIWFPLYGESIYKEKPFVAILSGDSVWYVSGSLPQSHISISEKGDTTYSTILGGVAEIEIRKSDGSVIKVCHGK